MSCGLSFRKLFSPIPCTFMSSSIFLGTIVSSMFIGVNSKCAHQVRPPLARLPADPITSGRSRDHSGHVVLAKESCQAVLEGRAQHLANDRPVARADIAQRTAIPALLKGEMPIDWTHKWRHATILANHECARGSRWITLRAEDEHPVPTAPGNVLVLRFGSDEVLRHAYTVTWADAAKRTFSIIYRVIPEGRMTPRLAALGPDASVEFRGIHHNPIRHEVNSGARQVVGLATGTGVGPLYGYFRYVLENNLEERPLSLFVGFREEVDIGPRDELDTLAAKYSNFTWAPSLSRPHAGWKGLTGRISESVPD